MEEWIGQWWHRAVTRAAEPDRAHVQVTLDEMRRSIALLYRAGGGNAAVRVAPVADSPMAGPVAGFSAWPAVASACPCRCSTGKRWPCPPGGSF